MFTLAKQNLEFVFEFRRVRRERCCAEHQWTMGGIPWEVNTLRFLFNVWTQTGKAAEKEREKR